MYEANIGWSTGARFLKSGGKKKVLYLNVSFMYNFIRISLGIIQGMSITINANSFFFHTQRSTFNENAIVKIISVMITSFSILHEDNHNVVHILI